MTNFQRRFNNLHRRSGLSQAALSDKIKRVTGTNIPQTTLSGYLTGNIEPSIGNASAIAQTYNVSLDYMAGRTEEARPVAALEKRLSQLRMPPEIERAALLVARMSKKEQSELISYVTMRYRQWQQLNSLIELAQRIDLNGSIAARIKDLAGIDIADHAPVELVDDDLLSDGDPSGVDEQLTLLVS